MSRVLSVGTGLRPIQATPGPLNQGSPVWVNVRPDVRRGASVAADLLTALGKQLTWHGKGRNEAQDVHLAIAWMRALHISALVIINAQEAPLATLDTLRVIARTCDIDLWLLHRPPIDERTLRKITKMATDLGTLDQVPAPARRAPSPADTDPMGLPLITVDFPAFRTALGRGDLAGCERLANAYDETLRQAGTEVASASPIADSLLAEATRIVRRAPCEGELVARLRALQVTAWRYDHYLKVDLTTLLPSVDRPRTAGDALDDALLGYRQPQRALVAALTRRGIPLATIDALRVANASSAASLADHLGLQDMSDALALAHTAQVQLRSLQGAQPQDRLFAPDAKTLARFVNDATSDLGCNIAGRCVERSLDNSRWLARLGITLRAF